MLDSSSILLLFDNVLNKDIASYGIKRLDIRKGVQNMAHVYAPRPSNLTFTTVDVANYNDVAHRCAYLHKYAPFHTAMVQDIMLLILEPKYNLFGTIISSKDFRICSLGGGPGTDVIGAIAALNTRFHTFKVRVTIVDLMEEWKSTFSSMIAELSYGNYGILRTNVAENFLRWNYIGANLLDNMTDPVIRAISKASLVTLVKFVSAAACIDTKRMIKKIFKAMKPGALLLFIDNAAGGFRELICETANKYKFVTIFGPLRHYNYCNEHLKTEKFGYTSCFTTTVTVHLLQKPLDQRSRNFKDDMSLSFEEENDNMTADVTLIAKTPNEKKIPFHFKSSLSHSNLGLNENALLFGCVNKAAIPGNSNQQSTNISSDIAGTSKLLSAMKINPQSNLSVPHIKPKFLQSAHLPLNSNKECNPVSSNQQSTNISNYIAGTSKFLSAEKFYPQSNLSASHNTSKCFQSPHLPLNSNNKCIPVSSNQQSTNISRVAMHSQKIINKAKVEPQSNLSPSNSNQESITNSRVATLSKKPIDKTKIKPLSGLTSSHNKQQSTAISGVAALSQTAVSRKNINPQSGLSSSRNSSLSFQNPNVPKCIEQPATTQNINNPNKSVITSKINHVENNKLPANRQKTNRSATITKSNRYTSPYESNNGRSNAVLPTNSNRTNTALSRQSQINAFPETEENSDACCSCVIS